MRRIILASLLAAAGCLGQAPSEDHAATGQDPAGTAPMPTAPTTPPPAGTDDMGCGGMEFSLTRVEPNVMLVLDRSGSMGQTIASNSSTSKWDDLKSAVTSLVTGYDSQMRLGASLFSADGDCAPGNIDVSLAPAAGQTVLGKLANYSPKGNTPTATTLDNVIAKGMLNDATRGNYVVLATDGLPNCNDTDVTSRITKLYNSTPSVKTYVIGIGAATNTDPTLLNQWADAGHTARTGSVHYYQTNSPADLKAAFDAIVGGIVSCDFKMMQAAPDPTLITVTENGMLLSPSPSNGYTYDATTNTVTLTGAACDMLRTDASTKVSVQYGCPGPPPIP
jgi:hypothetical protein